MLRPRPHLLVLAFVLSTVGCQEEIPQPPLCPSSATEVGRKIQQVAMQAFGLCIQDPSPGSNPEALTGTGGGVCSPADQNPCGACVLTCSAKNGDNCADDTPSAATIACAQEQCATFCQ
jgi:hypothetical protein